MLFTVLAFMAAAPAVAGKDAPPPASKLLQSCDAHQFETFIQVPEGLSMKRSRVKVCGFEGQSDADWIRTLKDAVTKTEANSQMPKAAREQIVAALRSEIARLSVAGITGGPSSPRSAGGTPVLDGIAAMPALPMTKQAQSNAGLPAPRAIAPAERPPEYSALPALPTTPPPPPHVLAGGASATAALPQLPKPRMSLTCYNSGDVGEGPCTEFARDTMVTVQADEDLPSGTSLRFVRNGDPRADVQLAQLRKGKSQQFALPPQVCSHISGATLEIRIVRSLPAAGPDGEEVGTEGPYNLRC